MNKAIKAMRYAGVSLENFRHAAMDQHKLSATPKRVPRLSTPRLAQFLPSRLHRSHPVITS